MNAFFEITWRSAFFFNAAIFFGASIMMAGASACNATPEHKNKIYALESPNEEMGLKLEIDDGYTVVHTPGSGVCFYHMRSQAGDVGIVVQIGGRENLIYEDSGARNVAISKMRLKDRSVAWRRSQDKDWFYSDGDLSELTKSRVQVEIMAKSPEKLEALERAFILLQVSAVRGSEKGR